MQVDYITHMGDDLFVVNAARVSHAKEVSVFGSRDDRILRYMAEHGHWSPFAHPQITFRVTASIAVARQLFRHTVGITPNEVSRRYVDDDPVYDLPEVWRGRPQPGQSKQGSSGEVHDMKLVSQIADAAVAASDVAYKTLLELGVAPEQARLVLPLAMQTTWIWTGSLYAFVRICKERLAADAQAETREVVQAFHDILIRYFPRSMAAWGFGDDNESHD